MFYTEEDIQPVVDAVTAVFGTVGNMSNERGVLKNVAVSTPEFGKVWYGDFNGSMDTINRNLSELSSTLGFQFSFEVN